MIPVGVIEDHPLYRAALTRLLAGEPDIEVDGVAESVTQFAARRQHRGGVVVLDLHPREMSGAAAVLAVAGMGHRVLVLSAHASQPEVLNALAAGARGYLCKDSDAEEILRAIREIATGNNFISPSLASFVLRDRRAAPAIELSLRERQVLSLVAAGERDQDIAATMHITIRTVRSYLDRIRDKTGRRRRPELTRFAIEEGLATSA
jgi:DNA-binding NarL/FixJ family response regulator